LTMPRARKSDPNITVAAHVLEPPESTVLDLIDSLLNKGVMANGDVTLGVAGVDLIYLRLSSILCAADRIKLPIAEPKTARRPKRRARR
jgi:Gas vesicle protein